MIAQMKRGWSCRLCEMEAADAEWQERRSPSESSHYHKPTCEASTDTSQVIPTSNHEGVLFSQFRVFQCTFFRDRTCIVFDDSGFWDLVTRISPHDATLNTPISPSGRLFTMTRGPGLSFLQQSHLGGLVFLGHLPTDHMKTETSCQRHHLSGETCFQVGQA
ncbi:hypothetical protein HBI56_154680 [Parastagonospora nodorum]|uniref:Uncharacterized protein n=1 Tax=Phaeosphaeria nodorum (strain SN15 / ATCC MYA-4574 / FGSC 10173) TaxID=321614 RepID=A0A7U2FH51_PHANO|nr:hypothetical protein HBH56_117350 [Parastagonospora nodorum]QRD05192.1 hypothetical protein JI435_444190 [Parastagonospora nodorum SN15]KAH3928849.1 hypothetical protein HBH54_131860 [Parastagonospora nodorum]KAH3950687.1 hypothetical protein HBH53_072120 [Parastagonospora nodorum]KAH3959766.1 hypothetical protein HBH51_195790 [Parastagonospora nodorum]